MCVSSSRGQLAAAEMRAPVRRTATDGRMGTTAAAEGSSESTHANSRGPSRHLWKFWCLQHIFYPLPT